jgi:hypothetical protein
VAKSTGPILAIGAMTIFQQTLGKYNTRDDLDMRVVAATGLTIGAFALLEKVNQPLVVGLAWIALVTKAFVPLSFKTGPGRYDNIHYRSFVESLILTWDNKE